MTVLQEGRAAGIGRVEAGFKLADGVPRQQCRPAIRASERPRQRALKTDLFRSGLLIDIPAIEDKMDSRWPRPIRSLPVHSKQPSRVRHRHAELGLGVPADGIDWMLADLDETTR